MWAAGRCYGGPHHAAQPGRHGVEFKLSGRKVLSNIKIDVGQDKTTYQIFDPENGSIIAVGSIPANEWNSLRDMLFNEIDDVGAYTVPHLVSYLAVLLVHSGLERVENGR